MKETLDIKSRKYGKVFSFIWNGRSIRLYTGDGEYKQICEDGFRGDVLTASSTEQFRWEARWWYRNYVGRFEAAAYGQ